MFTSLLNNCGQSLASGNFFSSNNSILEFKYLLFMVVDAWTQGGEPFVLDKSSDLQRG